MKKVWGTDLERGCSRRTARAEAKRRLKGRNRSDRTTNFFAKREEKNGRKKTVEGASLEEVLKREGKAKDPR